MPTIHKVFFDVAADPAIQLGLGIDLIEFGEVNLTTEPSGE